MPAVIGTRSTGKSLSARARGRLTFEQGHRAIPAIQPAGRARPPGSLEVIPEGQADFPVGGISWFEANAYAQFVGKRLPSIYHWYRAANPEDLFADILRVSNFDSHGPVKVGERAGLGPWGTLDMAGNVKEWCANGAERREHALHPRRRRGTSRTTGTPSPMREIRGSARQPSASG